MIRVYSALSALLCEKPLVKYLKRVARLTVVRISSAWQSSHLVGLLVKAIVQEATYDHSLNKRLIHCQHCRVT